MIRRMSLGSAMTVAVLTGVVLVRSVLGNETLNAGESRAMLRYLSADRDVSSIAVIHAPNIYGEYFRGRVDSLAGRFGYEFVGAEALPNNPVSASEQMSKLAALNPDIVLMALYPAGARKAIEAKADLGWDVRLVSAGPLTDEQYLNVAGGEAEGTIGFCHYPDPNESEAPGIARYRSALEKYFPGHAANRYSLYGYVFGQLVVEGLRRGDLLNGPGEVRQDGADRRWCVGDLLLDQSQVTARRIGILAALLGQDIIAEGLDVVAEGYRRHEAQLVAALDGVLVKQRHRLGNRPAEEVPVGVARIQVLLEAGPVVVAWYLHGPACLRR